MKGSPRSFIVMKILENLPSKSRALLEQLLEVEWRRQAPAIQQAQGKTDDGRLLHWRAGQKKSRSLARLAEDLRAPIASFERERQSCSALLRELTSLSPSEQTEAVSSQSRFHSLALCEHVLEASRHASFEDPKAGKDLAELGLQIARNLDPDVYGDQIVKDLCGRAWSELGNAFRVSSDLGSAERSLLKAGACLLESYDPLEKARFFNIKAVLRKDQRRFKEALGLRERAIAIYRRFEDMHHLGLSLCSKGSDLLEMAEPELAAVALHEAVGLIDPVADPRLFLAAHHNLATALVLQERYLEATEAFSKFERLYRDDLWSQARRQWLRGRIAAGLGQLKKAEEAFRTAREGFRVHDIPYDFALVSIELALVYARQNRTTEVKQLAAEMVPIFRSRHIHREALAALTLFRQAVEQENITVGTLRKIIDRLERAPKKV